MPLVLIHGVPETPAIWNPLLQQLNRHDVVTLQLPGFGIVPVENFTATKEEYVEWLIEQLESLKTKGPIDLLGHDWGGALVVRAVSLRPDLVRSWITDTADVADPDFKWHKLAQIWQSPEKGEAFFARQLSRSAVVRGGVFASAGAPSELAHELGTALDTTMADCILSLYRSAIDIHKDWKNEFCNVPSSGLVLVPSEDEFLSTSSSLIGAQKLGIEAIELTGSGHWWMLQHPAKTALILQRYWKHLP